MTERELQADLRALIRRWEAEKESCVAAHTHDSMVEAMIYEDCIADVRELIP